MEKDTTYTRADLRKFNTKELKALPLYAEANVKETSTTKEDIIKDLCLFCS